ncbi:MAG: undecaprenyldiphospho-muramoylpentapeptide beta-N-acetylglucosaminyltransferase [Bacilli bacterium]|nr:undecaprenyldiphospho-muramoylpentapeptide beta-N-acetylglucosaminyltransferase [Bacilli bacterium]
MNKIVFVGGGTLGHVFPMVPVVNYLKMRNPQLEVYFIGTKNGLEKEYIEASNLFIKTYFLDSKGFKRKLSIGNIVTIYRFLQNYFQSRKILKIISPDLVVGMGGYVSGAVLKAALSKKIKTAIHEQNAVFGLANRFLKSRVDRVLLAYDIEKSEKTRVVGNPRTSEIYHKYKQRLNENDQRSVLIVGGSLGAEKINDLIINLKADFQKAKIKVILITGNKYYQKNIERLKGLKSDDFIINSFSKNLPELLLRATVVVSRSGATTIAEVTALRKVCLFIPSPNVTNNHQEKNALEVVKKEGALMIREKELNKDNLFENICRLLDDKDLRRKIINNLNIIADVNACEKFVKELDELMLLG